MLADDAETIVDEVACLHLVCYLRNTQWCLQLFIGRQIKNVVLGETWNVQCLVLVGVECHSIQTYLRLTHNATVMLCKERHVSFNDQSYNSGSYNNHSGITVQHIDFVDFFMCAKLDFHFFIVTPLF